MRVVTRTHGKEKKRKGKEGKEKTHGKEKKYAQGSVGVGVKCCIHHLRTTRMNAAGVREALL